MEREFPGEPYPAQVTEKRFDNVVCARIEGTEAEIRLTTDLYAARYPIAEYATEAWADASPIAMRATAPNEMEPVYLLLLFRRVQKSEES